jgi:hypothetical protein
MAARPFRPRDSGCSNKRGFGVRLKKGGNLFDQKSIFDFAIAKGMASGRIGVTFLFFTPVARGAIVWSGCRPTGALDGVPRLPAVVRGFGSGVRSFIRVEGFWDEDRFLIGRSDIITKP